MQNGSRCGQNRGRYSASTASGKRKPRQHFGIVFDNLLYAASCLRPSARLLHYRINMTMELLRFQNTAVGGIAKITGFSSLSHFTKLLCARPGKTPTQYCRGAGEG